MQRRTLAQGGIVLAAFAASAVFFTDLPARMAIHWGPSGSPNGYASRAVGAFLLPGISALALLAFRVLPRIDPFGRNYEAFRGYYDAFVTVFLAFLLYVHGLVIAFNLGYAFDLTEMVLPAAGILVYVAGVVIERADRNWFVGIRTPWTLSNDVVWERTHEVGGTLFKLSGLIALLGVLAPEYATYLLVGPLAATALFTTVYSYWVYRSLDGEPDAMSA